MHRLAVYQNMSCQIMCAAPAGIDYLRGMLHPRTCKGASCHEHGLMIKHVWSTTRATLPQPTPPFIASFTFASRASKADTSPKRVPWLFTVWGGIVASQLMAIHVQVKSRKPSKKHMSFSMGIQLWSSNFTSVNLYRSTSWCFRPKKFQELSNSFKFLFIMPKKFQELSNSSCQHMPAMEIKTICSLKPPAVMDYDGSDASMICG